jgi:hypothetical protein
MAQEKEKLTNGQIREILCAPEPTDSLKDIVFDEPGFDLEAERDFVQSWLDEAGKYIGRGR